MNGLRTLLPEKLVNPTRAILQASSRSGPEKLAAQVKDAAVTGSNDIQKFKKDYHSDRMRELFQKVNAADISQGQDVWTTDYIALVRKAGAEGDNPETSSEIVKDSDDSISDLTAMNRFRDANPDLKLKTLDEASGIPLELTTSPATFYVSKSTQGSKSRYTVALEDSDRQSQLGKDVVKYIQAHHGDERLPILLVRQPIFYQMVPANISQSLLASYESLRSQKCEKCHKVFDAFLQFPIARDRRPPEPNQMQPLWTVRHPNCTP